MPQTIWIARHANRLDFVNPEWFTTAESPYDPPLSNDGFLQAQQLAQRLQSENITQIFSSPFLRTVQTAHQVAITLALPLKVEAALSEWLNPHWMNSKPKTVPLEVLAQEYPRIDLSYQSCMIPEYPETEARVMERSGAIARQLATQYSGEDILLVGHGASVLGTTWGLVEGKPEINACLCCLVKLVFHEDQWQLELNGDNSHLSQTESTIRFN